MKSSMKDKVKGTFHEAKGKVKEVAGKITDNPKLEAKGKAEKLAGKAQERSAGSRRFWGSRRAGSHARVTPANTKACSLLM
jgi:uncharacterized protein YjbJ (UPF0337 family)